MVVLFVCHARDLKDGWLTFSASKRHELRTGQHLASFSRKSEKKRKPFERTLGYHNGKVSSLKTRTCLSMAESCLSLCHVR